jgi:hypothetical protein
MTQQITLKNLRKSQKIAISIAFAFICNFIVSGLLFSFMWMSIIIDKKGLVYSPDIGYIIVNILQIIGITVCTYIMLDKTTITYILSGKEIEDSNESNK